MKTGFIHGYPNKPVKVRYGYHGLDRDCLVQPDPPPFEDFPTGPPLGEWVLHWEGVCHTGYYTWFYFNDPGFPKSSDDNVCPEAPAGTKNVYYFTEAYIYQRRSGQQVALWWGDGLNCYVSHVGGYYKSIYKAWFNWQWFPGTYLWAVWNAKVGSHARCWKSLDGEFPGYFPVPQKEIIIPQ